MPSSSHCGFQGKNIIPFTQHFYVAQQTAVGTWTETTALDLEGVPEQTHGNDCGVFMIMDNDGMDQHNVVTTTRDVGILSNDVSYDRLVGRAQQAEDQRRVSSDLLVSFITQDKGLLLHLEEIIAGKVSSTWATSKGRVDIFFEEDEQLDRVMGFFTSLVEAQTTRCHNQVAFMMDVLLPELSMIVDGRSHRTVRQWAAV
ncbi:transcript variant X7 [Nothobranchius furzeri]|uniref:Transcript variant X10 n=1 Tax=Nothobranchius furzeri TaxID=105023 RepID=A0A9D2Y2T6_NOTFU|nr:transcript variant X11 [Nothobranchius furzeri]KAF7213159.1 transcript variant X10 [Nothobranchius furzeri]KAF7213163.1 transcript variant X9 [Nothobranchius furzeri]KAF7213164.1 transcript variant X8 [Nothobranchius furzeri]KAF7213165.1 transcript variant X7 [Nothobranchius furzeri]